MSSIFHRDFSAGVGYVGHLHWSEIWDDVRRLSDGGKYLEALF